MKLLGEAFLIAFSMYSAIPVPIVNWNEKNMRYAMAFFPLVGVVTGGILWGVFTLCQLWGISAGLSGALAAAVPILVTGGIHLDGYCDTMDALFSHQDQENKLRILKDSHVGAFAVIYCVILLIVEYGFYQQLYQEPRLLPLILVGFVLSRCLSGMSVLILPQARKKGLSSTFSEMAVKRRTLAALAVTAVLCAAGMLILFPVEGAVTLGITALWCLWFRRICLRQFGGVTGDLAGYFLIIGELLFLICGVLLGTLL